MWIRIGDDVEDNEEEEDEDEEKGLAEAPETKMRKRINKN